MTNTPTPSICLMGASFSTGNLGVSALAEGALEGLLGASPRARITLLTGSGDASDLRLTRAGRQVDIRVLPIRYGKNLFARDHLLSLHLRLAAARAFPSGSPRRRFIARSPVLSALASSSLVADLSGGDSFTDIYGPLRMALQFLFKRLPLSIGARYVLLPQTIGPFQRPWSRAAARSILRRASAIYTRDSEGLAETAALAGPGIEARVKFAPDVALLVKPSRPADESLARSLDTLSSSLTLIGLNVSGLLASGGYTRGNQFSLKADSISLNSSIARRLLEYPSTHLVFIPHVIDRHGGLEDDAQACSKVLSLLPPDLQARTSVARGLTSAAEAKWAISRCSFMVGARMHSCIAALSQLIPAVGLAYSRKFRGVFESLGVASSVLDLRSVDSSCAAEAVASEYQKRAETARILESSVPKAETMLREAFAQICSGA